MSKYDKLKKQNQEQARSDTLRFDKARMGLDELALDASRTAEIYQNADKYLDNIDAEFERATGLSKTDISFLLLATALQIGRWVVIGEINGAVSKQIGESRVAHDDQSIKDITDHYHHICGIFPFFVKQIKQSPEKQTKHRKDPDSAIK